MTYTRAPASLMVFVLAACGGTAEEVDVWNGTPLLDVTEIVGHTPMQVTDTFGDPDSVTSEPVNGFQYPKHHYGDEFEVIFVEGQAEWLTIWGRDTLPFSKAVLPALGLEPAAPTFANPRAVIRWENHPQVREVSVFPDTTMEKAHYVYIIYRRPL